MGYAASAQHLLPAAAAKRELLSAAWRWWWWWCKVVRVVSLATVVVKCTPLHCSRRPGDDVGGGVVQIRTCSQPGSGGFATLVHVAAACSMDATWVQAA